MLQVEPFTGWSLWHSVSNAVRNQLVIVWGFFSLSSLGLPLNAPYFRLIRQPFALKIYSILFFLGVFLKLCPCRQTVFEISCLVYATLDPCYWWIGQPCPILGWELLLMQLPSDLEQLSLENNPCELVVHWSIGPHGQNHCCPHEMWEHMVGGMTGLPLPCSGLVLHF